MCACVCVGITLSPLHQSQQSPYWARPRAMVDDRAGGGRGEGHAGCPERWNRGIPPEPSPSPHVGLHLPTVPPTIKTGLPDLSTTEGSHALLTCSASGSPEPTITWEKDGLPVSGAEGKFTIQPSGELLVKNLEVSLRP